MNLELLFPTPVAFFDLGFELTKEERSFLLNQERRNITGNESSVKNYLLKEKKLARLSGRIQEVVDQYVDEVWKTDSKFFVTQSWVNWTKPGQYHHRHAHPNSMYSGVFYVHAEDERDKITFYKSGYQQISPIFREWTFLNSDSWWLPVKTNQIVMFPSWLEHMVEPVKGDEKESERVSLAFNTFSKQIGDNKQLTELIL